MTGALAMGTNKITGLGTPTAGTDATTKTYVDTADALKLNLAGGTMSGAIAMVQIRSLVLVLLLLMLTLLLSCMSMVS